MFKGSHSVRPSIGGRNVRSKEEEEIGGCENVGGCSSRRVDLHLLEGIAATGKYNCIGGTCRILHMRIQDWSLAGTMHDGIVPVV